MSIEKARKGKGKITVKATSETLVAENLNRRALFVSNPSAKEVWLALGPTAVSEEGIWVKKETTLVVPLEGYTGPVAAITKEGEGTLAFAEL